MSDKSEKKTAQPEPAKTLMFTCKICGESKPVDDLVILRQFYPVLSSCRECCRGPKVESLQNQD
jgi:hypothetical protein